jgi:hypothetical protein
VKIVLLDFCHAQNVQNTISHHALDCGIFGRL